MPPWLQRLNGHFLGRILTTLVVGGGTMVIYWALNDHLTPRYDLSTRLDFAIPFLPWTIVVYFSFYGLLLVAAWVSEADDFVRLFVALLVANVCCYVGFILFTAHYPRPSLSEISPFWRPVYANMYGSDAPGNTFPSIHVASTMIVGLRLRRRHFGWMIWAVAITLSTLTVKQHFLVDVVAGVGVAAAASGFAFRSKGTTHGA
ncbi:MAG: phosphatase PAP2 family protein [Deltaproteobacteria bacterium]|nr:phosphatase PAP2 family protein [Deltaproteobacteria bacterium]